MRTIASSTLAEKDEASGDCFDDDTIVGARTSESRYRIKYSRCTGTVIRTCAHKKYNNICTIATSGLRGVDVLLNICCIMRYTTCTCCPVLLCRGSWRDASITVTLCCDASITPMILVSVPFNHTVGLLVS
jgi:hypothetical protein